MSTLDQEIYTIQFIFCKEKGDFLAEMPSMKRVFLICYNIRFHLFE